MKIALKHSNHDMAKQVAQQFQQLCRQKGLQLTDDQPDLVVSIGGDGTLLSAFHDYRAQLDTVRFVAVHTGHLGFYTDWRDYELPQLVTSMCQDDGHSVGYPLLEVTYGAPTAPHRVLALNEVVLKKVTGTMVCDVVVNDQVFETFRGDGLCVATPSGSTGLNKSLGGAVVHPRVKAMQLTEMASLNNRVYRTLHAPMIFPSDTAVSLQLALPVEEDVYLMVDNLPKRQVTEADASIQVRLAEQEIRFAKYRHTHFWDRVEEAFLGERTQQRAPRE